MTLRLPSFGRSSLASLSVLASLVAAALLACGSSDGLASDHQPDGGSPLVGDASTDGSLDGPGGDEGPIVQKEFPLTTPAIGGYALVDAFPGVVFDIPAAVVWPKGQPLPFVLERTGQIKRVENGGKSARKVLDYGTEVRVSGEGGAVGMAIHPQFGDGTGAKPYVYVWYNACEPATACDTAYAQRLQRYTWSTTLNAFDPASVLTMIEEREFENVHNAGKMAFGADGFLYFGNGDDIQTANHQTLTRGLFAGIFRIDVDEGAVKSHPIPAGHTTDLSPFTRQGYAIPNDNPFVGTVPNGLEEFYALGFRNPFSWSFDRQTGKMWLGDVGDSFREEINLVTKGGNYQWPIMEGELTNLNPDVTSYVPNSTPTPPAFYYSHAEMADLSSIFGGFVYHGTALPELGGKLLYTDWITGRIWSLDITQSPPTRTMLVQNQFKYQPLGWGQDNAGEVYFIQYGLGDVGNNAVHGGHVKKIVRDTIVDKTPKRLTGTFLFKDVPTLTPADDLVPYDVSSVLWSDGAVKKRWIKVPAGKKVSLVTGTGTTMDGTFKYPVGTMFIKQFDMAPEITIPGRTRHLETRVMVVGNDTTYGYTFRWREDGSDADLVPDGRDEALGDRNWHYPSPAQCWGCHRNGYEDDNNSIRNEKYRILGFTPAQLGGQVTDLKAKGVFEDAVAPVAALPTPGDAKTGTLGARAYAYLSANCSQCHHEYANYTGGGQTWIATFGAGGLDARHLTDNVHNYPMSIKLANVLSRPGLVNGKLIAPGEPDKSVLLGRIEANDPDVRMPPIARNVVDPTGAALIREWIAAGAPDP
jgi:glucose/arabinose dehydrogenase